MEKTYSFTIYFKKAKLHSDWDIDYDMTGDKVYENMSDSGLGIRNGEWYINVDKESESLGNAICEAIKDIESLEIGAKILSIEID
jgi:hypothetical protein